ncbi:hypothetical protein [Listeria newyorkensis]|uniref:hypothetical protein n=1 Tax=Listeria newyorkensis TaxID=1497681 RepID=UPI0010FA2E68|nr:hypothetical protein [Listeria newyorkensis]
MSEKTEETELYELVLERLHDDKEITVVFVVRWLRIGYDRATRICNRLVDEGVAEIHGSIYVIRGKADESTISNVV